jgi:hypothetical protein
MIRVIASTLCVGLLVFVARAAAQDAGAAQGQKLPAGMDPKMTSDDPEYGYSKKKPIKVGAKGAVGSPAAERAYLEGLRDEAGKPVQFKRRGSVGFGPDGNILDLYEVITSSGKRVELYIDMYHPKNDPAKQFAPKGFYKEKK